MVGYMGKTITQENEAKTIGINIKCALIRAGYTVLGFSKKAGIAQSTLSKLVNGKTDARVSTLLRIADVLKIDIKEFFEGI